jgi:hypothetical protein
MMSHSLSWFQCPLSVVFLFLIISRRTIDSPSYAVFCCIALRNQAQIRTPLIGRRAASAWACME